MNSNQMQLPLKAGINFYAYVENNPVNANDPSGEIALFDNLIGAGVAAGVDITAQYAQAKLTNTPFKPDWTRTAVATGFGFATSGLSSFLGEGIAGASYGAGASFVLRTGGNSVIGAAGNVGQTASINYLQGKNDSLSSAAWLGGGFGALGSVGGDLIPALSAVRNQAKIDSLSPGMQNVFAGIANSSGLRLGGSSNIATAAGFQLGNALGSGSSFIQGSNNSPAMLPSIINSGGSPYGFDIGSINYLSRSGAANGGYLLYPNKPNNNQMKNVYSK